MTKQTLVARRNSRESRRTVVTFDVELTFDDGVPVEPNVLSETILDAIVEYDRVRNLLLPGAAIPPSGERIIGASVGFHKYQVVQDAPPTIDARPEGWERSKQTRAAILQRSNEIDARIERLRELQAKLMATYEGLLFADTDTERRRLKDVARYTLGRSAALDTNGG